MQARAGRRDHHPVRLPDLRDARAAQDGLPRAAQPDGDRRCVAQHRGQPRRSTVVIEDLTFDDPADLRAAGARRHPRGLPARRRADARAAARDAARTRFEDISAVLALYRPGPDGGQRAQRLRRPQERPQAGRRRSTPSSPSRWPRSSTRPTAWSSTRSRCRRSRARSPATRWARPTCSAGPWARRRRPSWTPSCRTSPAGMRPNAATHQARDQGALWNTLLPFCDYGFNKSHTAGLRAGVLLDRPT